MAEKIMAVIFIILSLMLAMFTGCVLAICMAAAVMDALGGKEQD